MKGKIRLWGGRTEWRNKKINKKNHRINIIVNLCVVPALEIKAWQTLGEKKNVIMRLKSSIDYTKQETDESEDIVVCMTAEKFRVLHHGIINNLLFWF